MLSWFAYALLVSCTHADEVAYEVSVVYNPREMLDITGPIENGSVTNEIAYDPENPAGSNRTKHAARFSRDVETTTSAAACLEKKEEFERKSKQRPMQMVMILEEGEEARMACHFCEDTDKTTETRAWDRRESAAGKPIWQTRVGVGSPILWFMLAHNSRDGTYRVTEIKSSMHDNDDLNRVYISTSHTLVFEQTKQDDSGTYFCHDTRVFDRHIKQVVTQEDINQLLTQEGVFRFLVHLDILKPGDIPVKEVSPIKGTQKPLPSSSQKFYDKNLVLFWKWSDWGHCNLCDTPGERRKRGVCTVKKLDKEKAVTPWYLDALLNSYPSGVPCRSSLFHDRRTTGLEFVLKRPDEVQTEVCKEPCDTGFLKGLITGRWLSVKGLQSLIFGETKIPVIHVSEVNVTVGDTVNMACPRAKIDQPVMWVNKSKYIPSTQMQNQTKGRAWVVPNGTLFISSVIKADGGRWMCVVAGEKTGRITLTVLVTDTNDFWHYGLWVVMSFPIYFIAFLFLMYIKHIHRKQYVVADDDGESASTPDQSDETATSVESLGQPDDSSVDTDSGAGNGDMTESDRDNAGSTITEELHDANNAESAVDNANNMSGNADNTGYGYNARHSNFRNPGVVSEGVMRGGDYSENSSNTVVSTSDGGDQDATTTATLESSYDLTDDSYSNPTTTYDRFNTTTTGTLDGCHDVSDGSYATITATTARDGSYYTPDGNYPSTSATARHVSAPSPSTATLYSGHTNSTAATTSYGGYFSPTATTTSYDGHYTSDGSHTGTTTTPRDGSYYSRRW